MLNVRTTAIALFAAAMIPAAGASAQIKGGYPPSMSVAEIEARERAETARLNQEVLARAEAVEAQNEAEAARFARESAEHASAVAAAAAENEARLEAQQQAERAHAAAMEAWRARVAACEAGDRMACAPGM